jgi:hypothetical protein
MRDTRIEDKLRDVLRAEADGIPLTVSAAELDLRLRLRRSQRANRRLLLGAAAALAIAIGAGAAALMINRSNNQSVATSPSPSVTAVAPSGSPTSVEPSPNKSHVGYEQLPSESELVRAAQASHPGFVLATSGDYNGAEDTETYDPGTVSTGSAGQVPVTNAYVIAAACSGTGTFDYSIGRKNIERRSAGVTSAPCDPAATVSAISDVALQTDVPLPVLTFADPHASWRLVVLVRPSALPAEPSSHEPTVACRTPGLDLPTVTLSVNGGASEAGEFGTTGWKGSYSDSAGAVVPTKVIHAKPGDDLRIRIGGDVCADHWTITYAVDVTKPGEPGDVEPVLYFAPVQENPERDLAFAAENRFSSMAVEGDWIINASLGYPDGDAQVYWHLLVEP